MSKKKNLRLGDQATDKMTGFSGTVIARIEYITGCVQYQIQPYGIIDGKRIEPLWFDEMRLGITEADNGGPVTSMPKPEHP